MRATINVVFLLAVLILCFTLGYGLTLQLADEQAFKVTSLDAASGGTERTRLRITGEEDPARVVIENSNVGIGVSSPTEDLEVAGAVKIGNASGTANGTVRWTGTALEGRNGGAWVDLLEAYRPYDKIWFLEQFERNSLRGSPNLSQGTHNKTDVGGVYEETAGQDLLWHAGGTGSTGPWDAAKNPIGILRMRVTADGTSGMTHGGLFNEQGGLPDSGIGFKRDYGSGKNWIGFCTKNDTTTTLDTGVAGDSTWRVLKFAVTGGGTSVEFFVDGASKGSITTNVPTDRLSMGVQTQTAGSPTSQTDYIYFEQDR